MLICSLKILSEIHAANRSGFNIDMCRYVYVCVCAILGPFFLNALEIFLKGSYTSPHGKL